MSRGMALVVEQDEALDPAKVTLLSANAVVFETDDTAHPIKQTRPLRIDGQVLCHDTLRGDLI